MPTVTLAFAIQDGRGAADRLAHLLETLGFDVVAGDKRDNVAPADAVLALLTPAALADSDVRALLAAPSARRTSLVPLPISDPTLFPTATDLATIIEGLGVQVGASGGSTKYQVGTVIGGAVGDNAVAINESGSLNLSAAEVAQLVTTLRAHPSDHLLDAAELRRQLAAIEAQIRQVDRSIRRLHREILVRFDLHEQRIIGPILQRLDEHHAEQVARIIEVFDATAIAADELDRHLGAIDAALNALVSQSEATADMALRDCATEVNAVFKGSDFDTVHKLKVSIPIIPLLLSYDVEMSMGTRIGLEETWQALKQWASRS